MSKGDEYMIEMKQEMLTENTQGSLLWLKIQQEFPRALGGFLFSKISETPIVHVPKLFPLLHWSQNTFCFFSSSTPSHVGKFFRLQWEFQWENDQNKKNGQKSLFRGPKWFPKCLNGGFRGIFVLKSGLRILIWAPEVPFLVPPKRPKWVFLAILGVPKMAL